MKKLKHILKESINITRWAEKTDLSFPFLDEEERQELIDLFIESLEKEGYEIKKKKD